MIQAFLFKASGKIYYLNRKRGNMAKYIPQDIDIYVTDENVYGTVDNDIFHITEDTADEVEIQPQNHSAIIILF